MRNKRNHWGLSPAIGAVENLLQSQELAQALRPHLAKTLWADVVGPQVAGVTQVEKVQGGDVLVVRVKNSVWANELVLLKDDMLRRLNQALKGRVLTDIHFKASGLARPKKVQTVREEQAPYSNDLAQILLPSDVRARVETAVQDIKDEALRERIHRSLTRAARLEIWKQEHGWLPCTRCGTLASPSFSQTQHFCPLCRAMTK